MKHDSTTTDRPILVRFLVKDLPAEMQSDGGGFISRDADIYSLLSSALEKTLDQRRRSEFQVHPKRRRRCAPPAHSR